MNSTFKTDRKFCFFLGSLFKIDSHWPFCISSISFLSFGLWYLSIHLSLCLLRFLFSWFLFCLIYHCTSIESCKSQLSWKCGYFYVFSIQTRTIFRFHFPYKRQMPFIPFQQCQCTMQQQEIAVFNTMRELHQTMFIYITNKRKLINSWTSRLINNSLLIQSRDGHILLSFIVTLYQSGSLLWKFMSRWIEFYCVKDTYGIDGFSPDSIYFVQISW